MAVKIVKSVARVLEILEFFDEVQEPMPAIDIAERLNYPLASTHEILKTMVELGFFLMVNLSGRTGLPLVFLIQLNGSKRVWQKTPIFIC